LDLTSATPQPLNRLRKLWREGRPTFGAIATIPSIQTVQIMARSGFDWIVVDLEHGPIDLGSAHAMITATSGTSCIPLARIAANEPWCIASELEWQQALKSSCAVRQAPPKFMEFMHRATAVRAYRSSAAMARSAGQRRLAPRRCISQFVWLPRHPSG
jgi:hypothetical protein